jgi:2-polyprenyl-3-methyl-5-hydroxy-6-metoxy-1,4-benzoquinol methylase
VTTKSDFVRGTRGILSPTAQLSLMALPRRCDFLLEHIGPPPIRVLDVGCATGYISAVLMRAGHQVTGIELNSAMARIARNVGVDVLEHDLEERLPLETASVEAVHACEVVEHLFDTEGFLKELHRVLVPGGVLVLSTPNLNSLANRFRVVFGRSLPMWGAFPDDRHGGHIRVLNKGKATELLRRAGFRTDVVVGINQGHWARPLGVSASLSEVLLIKAVAA